MKADTITANKNSDTVDDYLDYNKAGDFSCDGVMPPEVRMLRGDMAS